MSEMWQDAMVEGFREMMKQIALFLPKLMALLTFLVLGLVIGWFVRFLLMRTLKTFRFDQLCEQLGLAPALGKAGMKQPVSHLIGRLSFWIVFLLFTFMGIDALDLPATANLMNVTLGFLPQVLAAILVALIGALLANFSGEATLIAAVNAQIEEAQLVANLIRWGVLTFTGAMVLTQLGIAKEIVVAAFSIIFGGAVLALAIALGLGGRTIAKEALERRLRRRTTDDEVLHI
jgi:Mechanosensitive ion channel, conserved TM helix